MTKNRLIFYAIFAGFNLASFIFTLILENNTQMLFSMVQYVPLFKYWLKVAEFLDGLIVIRLKVIRKCVSAFADVGLKF